jgi:hypothetical protein
MDGNGQYHKDNPLVGVGHDRFVAHYMDYQADYFQNNPGSKYETVADDNRYAFNEALLTWAENGLIGLLLAGGLVLAVFFAKRDFKLISNLRFQISNYSKSGISNLNCSEAKIGEAKSEINNLKYESERSGDRRSQICNLKSETILKSSLLSVLVFGMFAYPSDILPIKIIIILCLALLSNCRLQISNFRFQISNYPKSGISNLNCSEAKIGEAKSEINNLKYESERSVDRRSQICNLKSETLNLSRRSTEHSVVNKPTLPGTTLTNSTITTFTPIASKI